MYLTVLYSEAASALVDCLILTLMNSAFYK